VLVLFEDCCCCTTEEPLLPVLLLLGESGTVVLEPASVQEGVVIISLAFSSRLAKSLLVSG